MIIESLTISRGEQTKSFQFNRDFTLVFSQKNSVGKTLLLRLLVYTLGFQIPNTRGINFASYRLELTLRTTLNCILKTQRNGALYVISQDEDVQTYSLPNDFLVIASRIFNTDNPDVLNNLLGVFYIDQEKGWTLLNRGTPIGSNHFNIESLIQGLSSRSCLELYHKLSALTTKIDKYRQMFSVAEYQAAINEVGENIAYDTAYEEQQKKLEIFQFQKQPLENELKRLEKVIRGNTSFKKFITDMKLSVQGIDGNIIPVNEDTLVGFSENHEYLCAKRQMVSEEIASVERKITRIKEDLIENGCLVNVESLIQNFDTKIAKIDIDPISVKKILNGLTKECKTIEDSIEAATKNNNSVVGELHRVISRYAIELGVDDNYVSAQQDYIFTSDLKSLSGTILQKIVFSFKLAYICAVKTNTGLVLPIIIDSPSGREVDRNNVDAMMSILSRDFQDHQIIVASINKYNAYPNPHEIQLSGQLLGF